MFDDLKKDLTGAGNAIGGFIGHIGQDVAGDFSNAVHWVGQQFSGGGGQPQQPQQAPQANPQQSAPQVLHIQQPPSQGFQPAQPHIQQPQTPGQPLQVQQPQQIGSINLAPTGQNVNANLIKQNQAISVVKQPQAPAMPNMQNLGPAHPTVVADNINTQPQAVKAPPATPMQSQPGGLLGAIDQAANSLYHGAGHVVTDLKNMTGIPAAVDATRLGIGELTHNQGAIDGATTRLATNLPQFLPIAMAEGIKAGGQELVGAAFSPYVQHVADQQAQYAQQVLNDHTGDPVHDSAVDAYASGVREDFLNNELAQQGFTMNTSKGSMLRTVLPAQTGLVAPFAGAGEIGDPAAAFSSKVASLSALSAGQGAIGSLAQPGKVTAASVGAGALRGGIEGGIVGAAITGAPYLPANLPDISTRFVEQLRDNPLGETGSTTPESPLMGGVGKLFNDKEPGTQPSGETPTTEQPVASEPNINLSPESDSTPTDFLASKNDTAILNPTHSIEADSYVAQKLDAGVTPEEAIRAYQSAADVGRDEAVDNVNRIIQSRTPGSDLGDYSNEVGQQRLNAEERAQYHGTNPETATMPNVEAGDYAQMRHNPGIVENNLSNRLKNFMSSASKLSSEEKINFWNMVENPGRYSRRVQQAVSDWRHFDDGVNAYDHALGGRTPYWVNHALHNWDLEDPNDQARYMELANQRGLLDADPSVFNGFHNMPRIFKTVQEGEQAGFHISTDPISDAIQYGEGAISRLKDVALHHAALDADMGSDPGGTRRAFELNNGKALNVSDRTFNELRGFRRIDDPNILGKIYRSANRNLKATILSATMYHPVNINVMQAIPTILLRGHPLLAAQASVRGLGAAIPAFGRQFTAGVFRGFEGKTVNMNGEEVNIVDGAARMGTPLRQGSDFASAGNLKIAGNQNIFERWVFEQMIPVVHGTLVEAGMRDLANKGYGVDSEQAHALGSAINAIMGFRNSAVLNSNPHTNRVLSDIFLANQFTIAKFAVLRKAITQWGATRDNGLAGSYARRAVIGKYLTEVGIAMTANALMNSLTNSRQKDNWKDDLLKELVKPSIETPFKDKTTGDNIELSMPANFISEPASLFTSLQRKPDGHVGISIASPSKALDNLGYYGRSRLAVVPSTGLQIGTNTSFNGKPIYDRSAPSGTKAIQIATNAANSFLPIPLQSAAQSGVGNRALAAVSPTAAQAIQLSHGGINPLLSSASGFVALTAKDDKTTGSSANTTQYYNLSSKLQSALASGNYDAISGELKSEGLDPKYAHYFLQQYQNLHPQNTTDFNGTKYPTPFNPNSSQQKYDNYTTLDPKDPSHVVLSPAFFIDQQLSKSTPGYPENPLYGLSGVGTDASGKTNARALVALEYANMGSGDPQRASLLAANGGQNGWLANYLSSKQAYDNNYQSNLTKYMQSEGISQQAINAYWQNHPSSEDPLSPPTFDQNTTSVMNQYYSLLASDPTAASQFYSTHTDTLSGVMAATAKYTNDIRLASGQEALQDYPTETDHVKQILNSMPTGTDAASKKARAALINNNPDVNQYLADVALYTATKYLSQDLYKQPANPSLTQGQILNDGSKQSQDILKNISSMGSYDIGKNAAGQYQFMGAGGNTGAFGPGYGSSGSKYGSSKEKPFVPSPPRLKARKSYPKSGPKVRTHAKKVYVAGAFHPTHGSVSIKKGSNVLKPVKVGS